MNVDFAYTDPGGGLRPTKPIEYNENGVYGFILAHEIGHIISLSRKLQFDATIKEENCTIFFNLEGCSLDNSYLNNFNNSFYISTAPSYEEPNFVSQYARTSIEEDFAEVVGTYVAQENLPSLNSNSSGALHKVHQVFGENEFKNFRENFKKRIKVDFELGINVPIKKNGTKKEPIFNIHKNKRVPCSHVKDLMQKEIKKLKRAH